MTQYFWPENFRINDLVAWLAGRGHEITVLTGVPNYPAGRFYPGYGIFRRRREYWNGARVLRVPLVSRGKAGAFRLALNYISFALSASLLGPLRLRGGFDAIFVHEPSPITVGIPAVVMRKRSRAPIFFWVLDLWPESVAAVGNVRSAWILNLLARLTRWIYAHCEKVLVQSRAFIPHALSMGVAHEKIAYLPNWAEDVFRPRVSAQPPLPLPSGFRLMYAGNIGVAQDFPAILAAAEHLLLKTETNIQWLIVGDGREAAWLRAEVVRRGLQASVHLLGSHPPEQMPDFFAHADAMLVSLKSNPVFSLTIPAKLQAYLACGRPIVAMLDGEGAKILQESGAGWAGPAGDSATLAATVLRMARLDRAEREMMGESARRYYLEHFEREKLFYRIEAWMMESSAAVPPASKHTGATP